MRRSALKYRIFYFSADCAYKGITVSLQSGPSVLLEGTSKWLLRTPKKGETAFSPVQQRCYNMVGEWELLPWSRKESKTRRSKRMRLSVSIDRSEVKWDPTGPC